MSTVLTDRSLTWQSVGLSFLGRPFWSASPAEPGPDDHKLGGSTMAKRFKMTRPQSKRIFRKTADGTQSINFKAAPMRGGIRL